MTPLAPALAALLCLAPPQPVAGGAPDDDKPTGTEVMEEQVVKLPPITPEPRDSKLGSSTPGKADLATRQATTGDAAELLRDVPGVTLNGAGGISSLPSIHGLSDDRLRVQVDGIDLMPACPNHMNSPLSYADPTRVESVTVFAGITPVSVGGDSIGGSIQVKSAPPEFAEPDQAVLARGLVGGFYRSNGDGLGYTLGATAATERLSLTLRQSDSRADDWRAGVAFKPAAPGREGGPVIPGDVVASSAYRGSLRRSAGLAVRGKGHLVQLDASQQQVGFEGFPNQRMDMTMNDNRLYALRYAGAYRWGDLEARLSYQDTRHEMDMGPERFFYGTGMPMDTEAKTWGGQVKAVVDLSGGQLVRVGVEGQYHTLYDFWPPVGGTMGPNTFWNVDFGERLRAGVFAEWEVRWSDAWLTQAGLRGEAVTSDAGPVQGYDDGLAFWGLDATAFNATPRRRTDLDWDLAALARWTPSPGQAYEAGYARKTRSPNLYQRFPWSTNAMAALMNNMLGDGNGYVGLIGLRPEVAHTVRATADWADPARERWGVKAAAHLTRVQDYVDARRCDFGQCSADNVTTRDGFVLLQYANHEARLAGLDLSGTVRLAAGRAWGALTANLALGALRGDDLTAGGGLYAIMPFNAQASLVHRLGGWSATAEVVAVAAKRRVSQVRNEIPTAAYQVVNLRASFEWKVLRLDAGVENLLDRLYANPLGGAYVGQGPSMSTSSIPWGVAMPGPGRSVNMALNAKF